VVLAGLERPRQALIDDVTSPTDGLCFLDLEQCRAGVPDREEQLRVLVEACGAMAPIHGGPLLWVHFGIPS
jgi:hypothetical protein